MARLITQLLIAVSLIVAAFVSWNAATNARTQTADEERRLTLQESTDYWSGRYDMVAERASAGDADSLLMAANAAFRKAQRDSGGRPSVEQLDQILQGYASALKNDDFSRDAAYNFEYVSRLRDSTAAAPRRARPAPATAAAAPDDLPTGPTIHGRPGQHPPATRGEEFEVITPMDYGEREAQPEPTPGRPFPRKG
jgi:hypothetical protein